MGAAAQRLTPWLLFGVLPVLLPFVRRASPPLLVAAALLSTLGLLADPEARKGFRTSLRPVPVAIGVAFLGWATLTLFWTPWLSRGAAAVASGWLVFGALVVLACAPASDANRHARQIFPFAVFFGAAFVALDLQFGAVALRLLDANADLTRYNMVLVSLVVLFCACLRGEGGGRQAIATASIGMAAAVLTGESETAKLSFAVAVAAYGAAHVLPRRILASAFALVLCVLWFGFASIAQLAAKFAVLFPGLAKAGHATERLGIWTAFSQLAMSGLPWGWGVESVAIAPALPFFATASEPIRAGLDWMHPHNNVIQVAAEMGAPGIALGLACSLVVAWWVQADAALAPPRAALAGALFTVALVSHGFWQMWFWAAAAVAVVALRGPAK